MGPCLADGWGQRPSRSRHPSSLRICKIVEDPAKAATPQSQKERKLGVATPENRDHQTGNDPAISLLIPKPTCLIYFNDIQSIQAFNDTFVRVVNFRPSLL